MIKNLKSVIVTPITNLDFEEKEVIDSSLLEEMEFEPEFRISVFNSIKQQIESVTVNNIRDYHWYMREGSMYKIIHIL